MHGQKTGQNTTAACSRLGHRPCHRFVNQPYPGSPGGRERYAHRMRNAGDKAAGGPSGRRPRPAPTEPAAPAGSAAGASLFTPAYRVSHGPTGTGPGTHSGLGSSRSGYSAPGAQPGPAVRDYPSSSPAPGYSGDDDRDVSWLGDELSAGFGWGDDDPSASVWPGAVPGGRGQAPRSASNAVHGFPPAPGEPLPVYPPGPFEAWNRSQDRPVAAHAGEAARGDADEDASGLASATITPDEFDTDYSLPAIKDPALGATAAAAAGATMTESASAGSQEGAARTAPQVVPGEPVSRGSKTSRAGGGPGHRASGRSRASARARQEDSRSRATAGSDVPDGGPASARESKAPVARAAEAIPETSPAKTRPPRKRRRFSHWLAIGAAVVIIAAVAGLLVYTLPKNKSAAPPAKPTPTSTPSPTATGPSTPAGTWGFIGARKTDTTPLTMAEVFPATISDGTASYSRAKQVMGKDCHASLIGTALQAAVRKAQCSQALRATYVSKPGKVMGTIGVFNLKNATQAGKAAADAGHSQFVAQLPAKSGPAKAIGQGTGLEEALVKGHYLVLVWAEPTNVSANPSGKKNKARLNAFMNLLVAHTVNVSLSYRMVNGKPPPSG
jgi:hypothetical protein